MRTHLRNRPMRGEKWRFVLAVVVGLCGFGRAAAEANEEQALATIERLGGQAIRDTTKPGKPVTQVTLAGKEVTDADLKDFAAFKQLHSLMLNNTEVTGICFQDLAQLKELTF